MTDEVTTTMTETSAAVTSRPPEPETSMTPQDITLEVFQETSTPSNTDAFERSTVTTGAPEPLTTTPPVVETDGPTDQSEQTMGPGVAEADLGGEVVVEDDTAGEECVGWKLGRCKAFQSEIQMLILTDITC